MFCRNCGQNNLKSDVFCISCGKELEKQGGSSSNQDTSRLKQKFPGLNPISYEHPDDKKALKVLKSIPFIGELLKQVYKNWHNLNYEIILSANSVEVTKNHFSEIYDIFKECAEILSLEKLPKFYITQSPHVDSYTTGAENTFIVIQSGLIDLMTNEELYFIIGHEMGHIKSNHIIYHDLATWLKNILTTVGTLTLGIGDLIGMGLITAITNWLKKSQFTADRAGLLACQDIDTATRALIKKALGSKKLFSQINIEEYIRQGELLEEDEDKSTTFKAARMMQNITQSHPFTTTRAKLLQEWVTSEDYRLIIEGDYLNERKDRDTTQELKEEKRSSSPSSKIKEETEEDYPECPSCGAGIDRDSTTCNLCGHKLFVAPPICPECFRDLEPNWTKCPHCKTNLVSSGTKKWLGEKYKRAKSFLGGSITNISKNFRKPEDMVDEDE